MKKNLFLFILLSVFGFSQKNTKTILKDFSIELPGKWEHTKDFGRFQFGFENKEIGGMFSVSIRDAKKIEYYQPEFSSLDEFQLLEKYYQWESDYWKENPKNNVTEIERNKKEATVLWKISLNGEDNSVNYFLNGIKNNYIIAIMFVNSKMDEQKKIELLKNIYSSIKYLK